MSRIAAYSQLIVALLIVFASIIYIDGLSMTTYNRYMDLLDRFFRPMGKPFGIPPYNLCITGAILGICFSIYASVKKKPHFYFISAAIYLIIALAGPIFDEYVGLGLTIINRYIINLTVVSILAAIFSSVSLFLEKQKKNLAIKAL